MDGNDRASSVPELELRRLSKSYGSIAALNSIDLTVPGGEFLTVLGPSGSGKTTILMLLAGFITPDSGDILVNGQVITFLPPEQRNFGMVFQGYALFPHLTVFENVAFSLRVRRRSQQEIGRKVQSALDLVQLSSFSHRMPQELSGGQQQRVALARALVFNPDVLLLDEPLGALDRKLRADVQIELKQIHARIGTTFVYVTHDQEEALSMSDRIVIIRDGRIIQTGTPTELYERPTNRFVAEFLGESNFLSGNIVQEYDNEFTYRLGSAVYRQAASFPIGTGQPVLLALRPEKVTVTSTSPKACNQMRGQLISWSYLGSSFHFIIETENGRLLARCPSWQLPFTPQSGMLVWLGWEANAAVVVENT